MTSVDQEEVPRETVVVMRVVLQGTVVQVTGGVYCQDEVGVQSWVLSEQEVVVVS